VQPVPVQPGVGSGRSRLPILKNGHDVSDILWLHEISEAGHRILNPFTEDKLMLLGEVSRVGAGTRVLDLACGKGELLWAQAYGAAGRGVDISDVFLSAARERAAELGVANRVAFELADAALAEARRGRYAIVSCIGATWIGGGLARTLELMRGSVEPDGLLLVGEPFWNEPPPAAAYEAMDLDADEFTSLGGTLERFEAAGMDLVEMVMADGDSWDRYMAGQWWTLAAWLRSHPEDPRRDRVAAFLDRSRRSHTAFGRRYLGWGVFVLRPVG
jgi:SAM-dependent methyltransferase